MQQPCFGAQKFSATIPSRKNCAKIRSQLQAGKPMMIQDELKKNILRVNFRIQSEMREQFFDRNRCRNLMKNFDFGFWNDVDKSRAFKILLKLLPSAPFCRFVRNFKRGFQSSIFVEILPKRSKWDQNPNFCFTNCKNCATIRYGRPFIVMRDGDKKGRLQGRRKFFISFNLFHQISVENIKINSNFEKIFAVKIQIVIVIFII
jgi:hypothetical protein